MNGKKYINNVKKKLETNGWTVVGGKQLDDRAIYKVTKQGREGFVLVIPPTVSEVDESDVRRLLSLQKKHPVDVAAVATPLPYSAPVATLIDENMIVEFDVGGASTGSKAASFLNNNVSRRRVMLAGGGGLTALAGVHSLSNGAGGLFQSVGNLLGGGVIREVDTPVTTTEEYGMEYTYKELYVGLKDGVSPVSVVLRNEDGEVEKRSYAEAGESHTTMNVWGSGPPIGSGDYDILVVDSEGEILDTRSITFSIGDFEINGVNLLTSDRNPDLYDNFELEISYSGGDLPIEVHGMHAVSGVPTHSDPPTTNERHVDIEPDTDGSYELSSSRFQSDPLIASALYSNSVESLECTGETRTAKIHILYSDPGIHETEHVLLDVEYTLGGTVDGYSITSGCSEASITDWSVVDEYAA